MALSPYWSGNIRLSLVSLPVRIYAATDTSGRIPLHEIYSPAGGEGTGRDETGSLTIRSSNTLDIVEFVNADAIDALYFESPYFVVPEDHQEDAFAVIRDALRETGKVGIGQLAIGGRERLCSLKPCGSGILLETLRQEDEVRESDPQFADAARAHGSDEALSLAKALIKRKLAKFDPSRFHDHLREALRAPADVRGEYPAPRLVGADRPPALVVDLTDALRESLEAQKVPEDKVRPRLSRRRKAG